MRIYTKGTKKGITVNQFDYIVAVEKMKSLVTIKSKSIFIKDIKIIWSNVKGITPYNILLMDTVMNEFLPEKIPGAASLRNAINEYAGRLTGDTSILDNITKTPVTGSNDYHSFMSSPGIPAYLKLAVLKAEHGN